MSNQSQYPKSSPMTSSQLTLVVRENQQFYFEPQGQTGRRLHMDIFAQSSQLARFRSLDGQHAHSGYTYDGLTVWHGVPVRRYKYNSIYDFAPQSQWLACKGAGEGELVVAMGLLH